MNGNANQKRLSPEDNAVTKQESPPVATKALKKNFASMDCGAKVLSANSEAQSPGNVISPHKDEYLLNKARSRKLFSICLSCLLVVTFLNQVLNLHCNCSAATRRGLSSSCAKTSRR